MLHVNGLHSQSSDGAPADALEVQKTQAHMPK